MPTRFRGDVQRARYGRFPDAIGKDDIARGFHLDERDQAIITGLRGAHNSHGFAAQLGTVRFTGIFPSETTAVPPVVLDALARQLHASRGRRPRRTPTSARPQFRIGLLQRLMSVNRSSPTHGPVPCLVAAPRGATAAAPQYHQLRHRPGVYGRKVDLGDIVTAHGLRATAATNALDHDADIAKVQEWLGHANISTTRLYDRRNTRAADSPTYRVKY